MRALSIRVFHRAAGRSSGARDSKRLVCAQEAVVFGNRLQQAYRTIFVLLRTQFIMPNVRLLASIFGQVDHPRAALSAPPGSRERGRTMTPDPAEDLVSIAYVCCGPTFRPADGIAKTDEF